MLKVMLKKQFLELFSRMFRRSAMGKRAGKGNILLYAALFLYLFGAMAFLFYNMADAFCSVLCLNGLTWLYFALISLVATTLGVIGSVFSAYSALYQAKDNEFLLSMPIPPRVILISRMITVYLMAFLFEALAWIPACAVYALKVEFSVPALLAQFVLLLFLPLLSTVLSCFLGWIIALIFAHVKHSQAVTLIFSLAFLGAYFYFYPKLLSSFSKILASLGSLAPTVKSFLYPFYHLGLGAQGNFLSLLLFAFFALFLIAVTFAVLSSGFLKLATTRKGIEKVKYTAQRVKAASSDTALLRKEFSRFTGSASYMLNGALGVVFLLVLPIFALIKQDYLDTLSGQLSMLGDFTPFIPSVLCVLICSMASMNIITAPSISLEGKTIWLVRSLPVLPHQVFRAKLLLHLIIVAPPTLFCSLTLSLVMQLSPLSTLLVCIVPLLFVFLCALFGLFAGLNHPNLDWNNEIIVIKQSLSTFLAMMVPWGLLILLGVICYLLRSLLSPTLFLIPVGFLFLLLSSILAHWLRTRGEKIFSSL